MLRRTSLLLLAALACPACVRAQGWPARPIRLVVPFPPAGAADAIGRAVAGGLHRALGVPVVVENKAGASGMLGADLVARAAPDGHTLLSHASSIVIRPHLAPSPFDVLRDLVPVTQTIAGSYVLLVKPTFPASGLAEWVDEVRRAPGRYTYGSFGNGSGPHLAMELLKAEADLDIVHVPFRGAAPALRELLAGRIDMAFETTFAGLPHVRAGQLKAIAVGGSRGVDALPDVPRVAELFPGFDTDGWQGLFAPAGTPDGVIDRLAAEAAAAVRSPEVAQAIGNLGFRPVGSTPAEFARLVRSEHERWGRLVRERRITAD